VALECWEARCAVVGSAVCHSCMQVLAGVVGMTGGVCAR
jgi:hypothetical protein